MGLRHIPVMVEEVISLLGCAPHHIYVDATLGGGGHTAEILKRTGPDGIVIGVEWDEDALSIAKETLKPFGERVKVFRENFTHLPELLKAMNIDAVEGILLDLGLSSIQLEKEERGFRLRGEGPLDMRMDQRQTMTAKDFINCLSAEELENVLAEYGEERWSRRIARAVVEERSRGPIETTQELRKIVYRVIPKRFQTKRIDPATRTFQALRIQVNDELHHLKTILERGWPLLKKGGRMCVLSFHSLEDRIVKEAFRNLGKGTGEGMAGRGVMRVLTKKPLIPSLEEKERNPRSRSAKLRCAERV